MLEQIMKLVKESFENEIDATYDESAGLIRPYVEGENDFYNSLRKQLEVLLKENNTSEWKSEPDVPYTIGEYPVDKRTNRRIICEEILKTYFNVTFDEYNRSTNEFIHFPIGADKEEILDWLQDAKIEGIRT